ncbi:Uridine-cytidine kinase-like 1 [Boothiomyces sp. JEL0866]|nr:Uridine-cytidine kinase-like 1 [Boothiomyces sp. JEL0866]
MTFKRKAEAVKEDPEKKVKDWSLEISASKKLSISTFTGKPMIDLRNYFKDKTSGEMKPTQKGIMLTLQEFEFIHENYESIKEEFNKMFNSNGTSLKPYIIGIAGGTASGKTSVSNAFDYDKLFSCLEDLKKGNKVDVPVYDFATHSRLKETTPCYGANVIIFEGIFALYDKRVRDLMDMKLFVDTDADVRLCRRLRRDIAERGRDAKGVLQQYNRFVKPSFDEYIFPTMKYADVIIPRGLDNSAAIDVIIKHVQRQLDDRGVNLNGQISQLLPELTPNVQLLEQKPQLITIQTILKDKTTSRPDFVFHADRLSRILVEQGLNHVDYDHIDVRTPTGSKFSGKVSKSQLVAVSIVPGGQPMEQSLRKVIKDIPIGKILIENSSKNEPSLQYQKLPHDIASKHIILAQSEVITGGDALMAIKILLEHKVKQENIILLTLMTTKTGITALHNAFPKVKIITASVEEYQIKDGNEIKGGYGNFLERYFGM